MRIGETVLVDGRKGVLKGLPYKHGRRLLVRVLFERVERVRANKCHVMWKGGKKK